MGRGYKLYALSGAISGCVAFTWIVLGEWHAAGGWMMSGIAWLMLAGIGQSLDAQKKD